MTQPKPADQKNPDRLRTILLATNSSQSIIAEVAEGTPNNIGYSVYGQQSAQQEVVIQLGFNGQLREASIGWYLLGNGYRAYNPVLMRFHSPDSWSPFGGGGLNAYMYCGGDPVNRSDPTGHFFAAAKLWIQENVSLGGSAAALAQRSVARRAAGIARQKAMYNLRAAGGSQISRTEPSSGEMSGMGGVFIDLVRPRHRIKFVGKYPSDEGRGRTTTSRQHSSSPVSHFAANSKKPSGRSARGAHYGQGVKVHDGPSGYVQRRAENYLQGGEVLPRKDHWPSNETFSSNGSSWTNASHTTSASSISSGRYSHASSLRSLDGLMDRLNALERGGNTGWQSSNDSFHSAISSIRSS